jgi:hypothetical protein
MKTSINLSRAFLIGTILVFAAACAPEVGSESWCKNLAEKPKGDWSANEAVDYAKYCL